ncbi:MAG TPA: CotH kinase family protein [Fibrobacteria bacterium]|nr:CotH kinase family protein [Fibrobacteria bacterium]HOX51153.1 CotH kinase family protein [Fibrobacteria bacterium]
MKRLARFLATLAASASLCGAQDWNLSGKVVDAEEGNGLKGVTVSLKTTGLSVITPKNGTWVLGSASSMLPRFSTPSRSGATLVLVKGKLSLSLEGVDAAGRSRASLDGFASREKPVLALRQAAVVDSLVFEKDGYYRRSIPLEGIVSTGRVDSIRRIRYEGWVDSSHSNRKADTLNGFTGKFRSITFKWSKQNWDRMMKAMSDSCGPFGKSGGFMGGTSKNCQDGQYDLIEKTALIWVPVDMETDGQVWRNVAIRLKGNASLQTAWTAGKYALPVRINMDNLEDSFPTAKDQRFYGFQKLSFYNSEQDSTSIRGPVAGEIFRQFGVPAPLSVPVKLTFKFGDTTKEVGLYEMVEVPDEPYLTRNFQNDSGNLYKPLSKLNSFVDSEWLDEDIPGDRADAKALIDVINASNRTTDSAAWHRALEAKLDVQGFLRWLAASTAIMNWDAYGNLAHNYYLFNDRGTFRFITYDFGWSFDYQMATSGIVSRTSIWYDAAAGGFMNLGPFPLVKNTLADKNYCESYRKYMTDVIAGPASAASFQTKVDKYASWVSAASPNTKAIQGLRGFMTGRVAEIQKSLSAKTCPIPIK